jgi:hypothetical protein
MRLGILSRPTHSRDKMYPITLLDRAVSSFGKSLAILGTPYTSLQGDAKIRNGPIRDNNKPVNRGSRHSGTTLWMTSNLAL